MKNKKPKDDKLCLSSITIYLLLGSFLCQELELSYQICDNMTKDFLKVEEKPLKSRKCGL